MKSYNAVTGEFTEAPNSPDEPVSPPCVDKITFVRAVVSLIPKEKQLEMVSDPEVLTAIAMLTDEINTNDNLVSQFLKKAGLTPEDVRQAMGA